MPFAVSSDPFYCSAGKGENRPQLALPGSTSELRTGPVEDGLDVGKGTGVGETAVGLLNTAGGGSIIRRTEPKVAQAHIVHMTHLRDRHVATVPPAAVRTVGGGGCITPVGGGVVAGSGIERTAVNRAHRRQSAAASRSPHPGSDPPPRQLDYPTKPAR